MSLSYIIANHGRNFLFQGISEPLYLSTAELEQSGASFWQDYLQKNPQLVYVIDYNFARDFALERRNPVKGLYVAPVRWHPRGNEHLVMKIPLPRDFNQILLQQQFPEYRENLKKIQMNMRAGNYYLLNYTIAASGASSLKEVKISVDQISQIPLGSQGCYFELPDKLLLGFSPEKFLNLRHDFIATLPIKGTVPAEEDPQKLLTDEKEQAESIMITDLMRNDLGEICEYGSVKVRSLRKVRIYQGLWQMYSYINGQLKRPFVFPYDLLKLLPAGSISGMPKRAVLNFLETLEIPQRESYTGIVGFFDNRKSYGFANILIRSLETRFDKPETKIGIGGGITIDSVAEKEYQECHWKLQSVMRSWRGLIGALNQLPSF